eukprot:CAMPEP_0168476886 /NCGR_PEP_ID=MMETSP0228-20121227/62116_1 /TAXON_ID=133427 /ORGANISM="Protoceratium reticulatum, Strain CCCM 535 (=CCMP 1889)" /LENGTH=179 /DNA_ID=CAMNT_0008493015 /DNA_START=75 /DNA_END=611 /DNA_ORIENTATION=-
MFEFYTENSRPPPNPFAPTANDLAEESHHHPDEGWYRPTGLGELGLGELELSRLGSRTDQGASAGGTSKGRAHHSQQAEAPAGRGFEAAGSGSCGVVDVDLLQEGRSYGVMEMLEGLPYQCTVVADPWAEVYEISKHEFARQTSKGILHKLFCDYKAQHPSWPSRHGFPLEMMKRVDSE